MKKIPIVITNCIIGYCIYEISPWFGSLYLFLIFFNQRIAITELTFVVIAIFWYLGYLQDLPFAFFLCMMTYYLNLEILYWFLYIIIAILDFKQFLNGDLIFVSLYFLKFCLYFKFIWNEIPTFLPRQLPRKNTNKLKEFFEEDFDLKSKLSFILECSREIASSSLNKWEIIKQAVFLIMNSLIVLFNIWYIPQKYCHWISFYLLLEIYSYRWEFIKSYLISYDIPSYMSLNQLRFEYKEYLEEIKLTDELANKIPKDIAKLITAYHRKIWQ